jgi:hypothetical protein
MACIELLMLGHELYPGLAASELFRLPPPYVPPATSSLVNMNDKTDPQ